MLKQLRQTMTTIAVDALKKDDRIRGDSRHDYRYGMIDLIAATTATHDEDIDSVKREIEIDIFEGLRRNE